MISLLFLPLSLDLQKCPRYGGPTATTSSTTRRSWFSIRRPSTSCATSATRNFWRIEAWPSTCYSPLGEHHQVITLPLISVVAVELAFFLDGFICDYLIDCIIFVTMQCIFEWGFRKKLSLMKPISLIVNLLLLDARHNFNCCYFT